jgi:hypothetical protein
MLKRVGIPLMALAGFLGFGAAKPALAGAHFGIQIGASPAYCSVYDPYYCPNAYGTPYGYPYNYGYPGVDVYPYTYGPGFGVYFGGGHGGHEHHEAHGHDHGGHEEHHH